MLHSCAQNALTHPQGCPQMSSQQDDRQPLDRDPVSTSGGNPFEQNASEQNDSSGSFYNSFEEDDSYEEPERDTDHTSTYLDDDLIEDDLEDLFADDDIFDDEPVAEQPQELEQPKEQEQPAEGLFLDLDLDPEAEAEALDKTHRIEPAERLGHTRNIPETWMDDDAGSAQTLPWGLIAVAVLALALLVAGGFGVVQQRTSAQEELRELRAALAVAAKPEEIRGMRESLEKATAENSELLSSVSGLTTENRRLKGVISDLEAQLEAQRAAIAKAVATVAPPAAKTEPPATDEKAQATEKAATPAPAEPSWFVNFGSYARLEIAQAWAKRLPTDLGRVIIANKTLNDRTLYRLRIVGLSSRDAAQKAAIQLERQFGLPKLWVGKQ